MSTLTLPNHWHADPLRLALEGSAALPSHGLPDAFCLEVGRRVLLAELEFGSWVQRRVESVSFEEGRSVQRTMTINFKIRDDAPVFESPATDGEKATKYWLVPLAVMSRRTLVEFRIRNEVGHPLTTPGLRLAQRLDEAVLLAAAATTTEVTPEIRSFVEDVVAGKRATVVKAMETFATATTGTLAALRDDPLFAMALARLRYNFTLYVFLPVEQGRDRLLTMSFVEPVLWKYQRPTLSVDGDGVWTYRPMQAARTISHLRSALGWTSTRIRFQTPSAEHAASYHFEVVAPQGVRIVEAALLAGRPHEPTNRVSVDHVRGDSLTIGLHAVEVPPNSLCRAQVHLRVQRAGWLTTLLVSSAAIAVVLWSVAWHAIRQRTPDPGQDTNVIVLLITTAAAAATFVAQRDFPGVAARLVTGVRGLGLVAMALPLAAAGFLSYKESRNVPPVFQLPERLDDTTRNWLIVLACTASLVVVLVLIAWWSTLRSERRQTETSPWDMTVHAERTPTADRWSRIKQWWRPAKDEQIPTGDFRVALTRLRFDAPAVGVRSSEGWHSTYCWNDENQRRAVAALGELPAVPTYTCAEAARCPHAQGNGCGVRAAPAKVVAGNGGGPA